MDLVDPGVCRATDAPPAPATHASAFGPLPLQCKYVGRMVPG